VNILFTIATLCLTLLAAACASPALPVASGPIRPLNAQHWTPTPAELVMLSTMAGEARP